MNQKYIYFMVESPSKPEGCFGNADNRQMEWFVLGKANGSEALHPKIAEEKIFDGLWNVMSWIKITIRSTDEQHKSDEEIKDEDAGCIYLVVTY